MMSKKRCLFALLIIPAFLACKKPPDDTPPIGNSIYTITISPALTNGSIQLSPANGPYAAGSTVYATAAPAAGYQFETWGGDLTGTTTRTAAISMDSNKTITATFIVLKKSSRGEKCDPTFDNPDPCEVGLECMAPPGSNDKFCFGTCESNDDCIIANGEACQLDGGEFNGICGFEADYYDWCDLDSDGLGGIFVCPAGSFCYGYSFEGSDWTLASCMTICDNLQEGSNEGQYGEKGECPQEYPMSAEDVFWAEDLPVAPTCGVFEIQGYQFGICGWTASFGSYCDESSVICNAEVDFVREDSNSDASPAGEAFCGWYDFSSNGDSSVILGLCRRQCAEASDCACPASDINCEDPTAPEANYCIGSTEKVCATAIECTTDSDCTAPETCKEAVYSGSTDPIPGFPNKICM